ncbi:flagellar biosynthesis regulatory protein FlaF [Pseudotabrizicola sediminis]|uniref:Flagellar biosynthesis regulatory protein FlaF n=1 Tax=Pseudotabrizicola sediminis TaxID=2486418 RepID=A0ABY2KI07_9RHOB|nr:flagellar biosynthesis regulator FlaF [Pseudotabrizicola sediminis]TGD41941.1 flagellar biosynthesis regulatory protein FlaF [Pseudotabrizicola sediminis]
MNAHIHAKLGYSRPDATLRTLRSIEYEALARVTQRLSVAWLQRKADYPALVQALSDNLGLWSTLAADVASPGNALPAPLRAQLFYLYEFSEVHTRNVLNGPASVEVLIDVNTAIMRGLRGQGSTE